MLIRFIGEKETILTSDMREVRKFATEEEIKQVFTNCVEEVGKDSLDIDYVISLGILFFRRMGEFLSDKAKNDPEFNKKIEDFYNKRHNGEWDIDF